MDHRVKPGGDELEGWLSQRVRPEVAGPMTGSAGKAWARRFAPLPALRSLIRAMLATRHRSFGAVRA
jgi:hypothetical protein